ncbi:hypothetical protein [Streptomyces sp. NPDC057257]|uniref:hypothetical protein n=1 Tax=Streptomyces sp. NPDC057257 TaxID=3346071 RepID=UPI00364417B2
MKGYSVEALSVPDFGDIPIDAGDDVCAAVILMSMFNVSAEPEARVGRTAYAASGDGDVAGSSVVLNSYQGVDAEQGMADLRKSVDGCPGGFEISDALKATAVKSLKVPDVGDEAVAFRLDGGILGADTPTAYTVVRSDTTLAVFFNPSLSDSGTVTVPVEVVRAQVAKLERVAG